MQFLGSKSFLLLGLYTYMWESWKDIYKSTVESKIARQTSSDREQGSIRLRATTLLLSQQVEIMILFTWNPMKNEPQKGFKLKITSKGILFSINLKRAQPFISVRWTLPAKHARTHTHARAHTHRSTHSEWLDIGSWLQFSTHTRELTRTIAWTF